MRRYESDGKKDRRGRKKTKKEKERKESARQLRDDGVREVYEYRKGRWESRQMMRELREREMRKSELGG